MTNNEFNWFAFISRDLKKKKTTETGKSKFVHRQIKQETKNKFKKRNKQIFKYHSNDTIIICILFVPRNILTVKRKRPVESKIATTAAATAIELQNLAQVYIIVIIVKLCHLYIYIYKWKWIHTRRCACRWDATSYNVCGLSCCCWFLRVFFFFISYFESSIHFYT